MIGSNLAINSYDKGSKVDPVRVIMYIIIIVGVISMLIPFYWMLITSLKPKSELLVYPPRFWVNNLSFEGYRLLFETVPFGRYFFNSSFVTLAVTAGNLIFGAMTGFSLAKHQFPGRNLVFAIFLASMMVPWQVNLIPGFVLVSKLGWLNTYQGLVIPHLAGAFGIFLMRQYSLSIPTEIMDAARIDGAGEFMIFFKIALPELKPGLAALGIFTFLGQWNNFVWHLVIVQTSNMRTLPLALSVLSGQFGGDLNMLMGAAALTAFPVILVFLFFQRYFVRGIALSGMKG